MADALTRFGPGVLSVSRGVGMERHEAPRVRLFCRPELRMITLVPPADEPDALGGTEERTEVAGEDQSWPHGRGEPALTGSAKGRRS
jgi:hypothetical protein